MASAVEWIISAKERRPRKPRRRFPLVGGPADREYDLTVTDPDLVRATIAAARA